MKSVFRLKVIGGYPAEWMELWKEDLRMEEQEFLNSKVFVLELDEGIIGFCALEEQESFYEVNHLWILAKHIGKGYGRLLLLASIQNVVQLPKDILVVADPNAASFYTKLGFKSYAEKPSLPEGRSLPIMKKEFEITK